MLKRKLYKKWAICFLSIFITITALVMSVNYAVDPMWCFGHKTPFAEWRQFISERQQKANLLRFRDFDIDTLIMGSSRVMSFDTAQWGENGFNFGVSGCMSFELPTLIKLFFDTKGYYPKHIVLGIDFFAVGATNSDGSEENRSIPVLLSLNTSPLASKLGFLANIELCRKSINLIIKNLEKDIQYADVKYAAEYMDAHAFYPPIEERERKKAAIRDILFSVKKNYSFFKFDEHYKYSLACLAALRETTKITPFITPEGTPSLRLIAETPWRFRDYERMLRETVEVFGGVWNFMYVNSVTSDQTLWRESSHYLPQVNEWIKDRITGEGTPPDDFGVYVTKDNIDEHIKMVRKQFFALLHQTDSWGVLMDDAIEDARHIKTQKR